MSIIFEALKKVDKKESGVMNEGPNDISQPEPKSPEVQTPEAEALYLNKSALIVVAIILGVGITFSFILKSKTTTPAPAPTTIQNLTAEGYAPPQPIPKQEPQSVSIFKPKTGNPKLSLNGIVYGLGKPTAIIENKILEEGESIKGAKVVKIYTDSVELLNETSGEIFVLRLH